MDVLPGLTAANLVDMVSGSLQSEAFDCTGERTGYPLFERYEDRRRSGTSLTGIIPLLVTTLNRTLPSDCQVTRERRYPRSNMRCDLMFAHTRGAELWCELKQSWEKPATPYETAFTRNEYLDDIAKLGELPDDTGKSILLMAFRNTERQGGYPVADIDALLGGAGRAAACFPMPTMHGQCYCHIILWHWK